jgi:hypothetical protein
VDARFMAIVNVPGYLPEDDDPPVFDTAQSAWKYLADERERGEDSAEYGAFDPDQFEYSDTLRSLRYAAGPDVVYGSSHEDNPLNADGTGVIYGSTPGYDGDHDLGLAYCVTLAVE